MPIVSLSLLGPLAFTINEASLNKFRTRSGQALLIYLAVEGRAAQTIRRAYLAELLYPGLPPAASKKNLRQSIYELRQMLATHEGTQTPLLVASRQTLSLSPAWTVDMDVNRFEAGMAAEELSRLEKTAGLYRGEFLSDFYLPDSSAFEAWTAERRAYYQRLALALFERLANRYLTRQAYDQLEGVARRQLELDDLHEPGARYLMQALAGQDRRSAALAEFHIHQQRLADGLGVGPAAETIALVRKIQAGDSDLPGMTDQDQAILPASGPVVVKASETSRPVANNLPHQPTPFIGREEELAEIARQLGNDSSTRLLTLLGPGGSGKSRLAIEAARRFTPENAADYPDGIWFVSLAAFNDGETIIPEVARSINMIFAEEEKTREQQLIEYLAGKKMLLILDNYEQLLAEGKPPFPALILNSTDNVRIIVTSRIRINIRGEQLLPLGGLTMPQLDESYSGSAGPRDSAVFLFTQSARRNKLNFELSAHNWPAIVNICYLLQGMPLALELAATWIEVLSPEEIATEIKLSLDFLESQYSDVPERQRSMRAVFSASWRLLSPAEKYALKRLSIFRGPFSRNAATAVAGANLKMLLTLVNNSWLSQDEAGHYYLHELLRQYSLEKLHQDDGDWQSAIRDLAEYFAKWLAQMGTALQGPDQKEALKAIEYSFENIRQAWTWLAVEGEVSTLTSQMLPAIFHFCTFRARGEDISVLAKIAHEAIGESENFSLESAILDTATVGSLYGSYLPNFLNTLNLSLKIPDAGSERAWACFKRVDPQQVNPLWSVTATTLYAWHSKRNWEAMDRLRQLITIYGETNDHWGQAFAMKYLAHINSENAAFSVDQISMEKTPVFMGRPDPEEATRLLNEAALIFEKLGDQLELADCLRLLGHHHHYTDPDLALAPLLRSKAIYLELGDPIMAAQIMGSLALHSLWLGEFEEGFAYFKEKRELIRSTGNRTYLSETLAHEAIHALRYSGVDHARQLRLQNQQLLWESEDRTDLAWNLWELGDIERTAGNLTLALEYFRKAQKLIEQEDIAYARIFYSRGMGDYALAVADYQQAVTAFQDSLQRAIDMGHFWATGYALSGLGRAYLGGKQFTEAEDNFLKAIRYTQKVINNDLTLIALAGLASHMGTKGDHKQAMLLASFVFHSHLSWLETKAQAQEVINEVTKHLPEKEAVENRRRGEELSMAEILTWVLVQEKSEEE